MFSLSGKIGIDLGTANTLVYLRGKGIILREPSVVALDIRTDSVIAVGRQAKEMIGRAPDSISVVRPLKDGVIADYKITAKMLRYFIKKSVKPAIFGKPEVVICMPAGVTEVERRAVEESAVQAGAKSPVVLIEEPMAAAVGAGLPVDEPVGNMIADIGGGTSEVAVISLGDIVTACSVRVAGNRLDEAVLEYIKKKYGLLIGEPTAEEIKIAIGSAYPLDEEQTMTVKGRNLEDGLPKDITITSAEVQEAVARPLARIVEAVKNTLEKTPPELSADIIDNGITLTGGGALLRGLDILISEQTGMPVHIAESPLDCVAAGAGKRLSGN